jgi:hypothetical protein
MRWPLALALALALTGCGGGSTAPLPGACTSSPQAIERALAAAPARVLLDGATPLSQCVARAHADAQLQEVGSVFSSTADDLALRAATDRRSALALGFLVGATRRGASHVNGIAAELVRRVEQAAARSSAIPEELHRGLRAGERSG